MNGMVGIANPPSSRPRTEDRSKVIGHHHHPQHQQQQHHHHHQQQDHHSRFVDQPRTEDRTRAVHLPNTHSEDRSRAVDRQQPQHHHHQQQNHHQSHQSSGLYVGGGGGKTVLLNQGSRSASSTPKNSGEFHIGAAIVNKPAPKSNSGEFFHTSSHHNGHASSNSSSSSPRTSGELGLSTRIVGGFGKANSTNHAHASPKASPDSSSGSSKGGSTPRASFEGRNKVRPSSGSPPRSAPSSSGNLYKANSNGHTVHTSATALNPNSRINAKMDYTMGNILNPNYNATTQPNSSANGSISSLNNPSVGHRDPMDSSCDPNSDHSLVKRGLGCSNPEEVKNIGNELYKRGCFADALKLYQRAIALSPGQASYRGNKAAALVGLCQLPEAVYECEEAIKLDPSYVRAHQRAASLYLRLGLVERSSLHSQAAREPSDSAGLKRVEDVKRHISKCIEMRKVGNWNAVLRESEAAILSGADSAPQVLGYKAEALLKLHKPEEADIVLPKALDVERTLAKLGITPQDSFILMIRAQVDLALGRFDEAVEAAKSAFHIDSRKADTGNLFRKACGVRSARISGNELFESGKYFEACAAYGEGLESDPSNAVLLCNRAACRLKLRQWEKALEDCNAALELRPNYTKALMRRADCNQKLERWEDALNDYEELLKQMPGNQSFVHEMMEVERAMKRAHQANNDDGHGISFGGDGVMEVSSKDQLQHAIAHPGVVVVQFIAKWNDQCRQISPFVHGLHKRYPSVSFVKVDVEENPYLAKIESVELVPTFKVYKDGVMTMKEIRGALPQAVEYAVQQHF